MYVCTLNVILPSPLFGVLQLIYCTHICTYVRSRLERKGDTKLCMQDKEEQNRANQKDTNSMNE